MNKGKPTANLIPLQGAMFDRKAQMAFQLQDLAFQTPELIDFRKTLVADMVGKVRELNRENFAAHQHLKYVERYTDEQNYAALSYEDTLLMDSELAQLTTPDQEKPRAR